MRNLYGGIYNGLLIGDLIPQFSSTDLEIERHKNTDPLFPFLLHSTTGTIKNQSIGGAYTCFFGEKRDWCQYENIRMNLLLKQWGYHWKVLPRKNSELLRRMIFSESPIGEFLIFEYLNIESLSKIQLVEKW